MPGPADHVIDRAHFGQSPGVKHCDPVRRFRDHSIDSPAPVLPAAQTFVVYENRVAEGVEQPYQLDRLVSLGCTAFQGWLYSPAVPPDELMDLLPRIVLANADSNA